MKQQNLFYILFSLTLFSLINTFLNPTIEEIKIKVNSLNCEFCTQNVTNKLLAIPQVKSVKLKPSQIILALNSENNFDPATLKRTIETNTGIKIKDIEITTTGKVSKENKNFVLQLEDNPNKIYLSHLIIQKDKTPKNFSFKRHPKKAAASMSTQALNKAKSIFKKLPTTNKKLHAQLQSFNDKQNIVRLRGSIKLENDGNLWLQNKKNARFIDADTDNLKLALKN